MKKTTGLSHAHIQMVLQKIPFFRGFMPDERERLATEQDSFVVAQPKELIVLKGSMERSFYILLSGVVEVIDREGRKPIFELIPGDFFGEISFLSETPRTASVRAQDVCILMRIDQQLMSRLRSEMREKIKDQLIDKLVKRILSQG
ncbi:Cyclic nucleotide-binding protein [Oleispira antarctica RB-8]|mgnify:CR=1 FL=1|uniref:Cyclic nucleotide-binding protein n=1 Tax=Oleispira antarctica RB-8 TaxID=698738 RepID=R4YSN5_OLEAN|nr:Cyclic nucleotide-binding protein [Oleispira antarctica RB-8]|tara:strand:- start:1535 stop:1972 length:438 start_codon:yes stop_codon:yes gene_type:complete